MLPDSRTKGINLPVCLTKKYWQNHKSDIIFTLSLIIILLSVIAIRVSQFWNIKNIDGSPSFELMVARGSGIAINFSFSLMILLMSRDMITYIRMTKLYFHLPIDHHVEYHKYFGGRDFEKFYDFQNFKKDMSNIYNQLVALKFSHLHYKWTFILFQSTFRERNLILGKLG